MEMKMDFASQNLTVGQVNAIVKNLGGEDGALKFLRGELVVQPAVIPEPPPEPVLDFIVRVDRSVKPSYPPDWKKLMHPELELSGPAEYNLQTGVEEWLHDDQKRGSVIGNTIYKHLQKGDGLANCLNLQDGLAIQQKGIAVFRKLFAGKAVFLWGSVVQNRNGSLFVPCLYGNGDEVGLFWVWLDYYWYSDSPALRFSNSFISLSSLRRESFVLIVVHSNPRAFFLFLLFLQTRQDIFYCLLI